MPDINKNNPQEGEQTDSYHNDLNNESFKLYTQQEIEKQNKQTGYYSSYGGTKENRYKDSHLVSVGVQINGTEYFTHTSLQLELKQKINQRHSFELIADPDEFGEGKAYLLQNSRTHLGKRITFTFRQWGKTSSLFTGIITEISTRKKEGIKQIILRGSCPSILMENGLHCRSFENMSFEQIIKEVIKDYPQNLINFQVNPNFKDKIAYVVQYNQSDFDFLKKLSARYGEYFLFDGEKYCFSAWGGRIVELMEGEDYFDHDLNLRIQPQTFSYTTYDPKQGAEYTLSSDSQSVQQSENPFGQFAVNASEGVFNVPVTTHYASGLLPNGETDIKRSVEREKRKRQNLVYIEAGSNNPNLRLGDVAKMMVWIPDHEIFKNGRVPAESFKVVEIVHRFTDGEGYSNTFTGVPRDLTVPNEYDEKLSPKAEIQHATVMDNKDPLKMGRVRLRFVWQKSSNSQTPWVQVIQPHAGTGKGTYINPEIGETVLCAFQGGDAEAPVVLGTAYNGGEIAEYYTEGNEIKVIQTRSGTKIVFNDAEGSILLTDPSGNSCFMDGKGNITMNAPKDIDITAGENINISAGKNLNTTVGENNSLNVGGCTYYYTAKNKTETVTGEYSLDVDGSFNSYTKQGRQLTSDTGIENSTEGTIHKNSQKNIKNNSGEKTNLF